MHRRRWLASAGTYLLLLAASHVFTPFAKSDAPAPDLRYAELRVVDRSVTGPGIINLAYRDTAPDSGQIPIVLVHGSPGSSEVLRGLADLLRPRFSRDRSRPSGFRILHARVAGLLMSALTPRTSFSFSICCTCPEHN